MSFKEHNSKKQLVEAFDQQGYEFTMNAKGKSDIRFDFTSDDGTEYQLRFRSAPKLGNDNDVRRVTVRQKQDGTYKDAVKSFKDPLRVMATFLDILMEYRRTSVGKATYGYAVDFSKRAAPRGSKIFAKLVKTNRFFKSKFTLVDTPLATEQGVYTAWIVRKGYSADEVFNGPDVAGILSTVQPEPDEDPIPEVRQPWELIFDWLGRNGELVSMEDDKSVFMYRGVQLHVTKHGHVMFVKSAEEHGSVFYDYVNSEAHAQTEFKKIRDEFAKFVRKHSDEAKAKQSELVKGKVFTKGKRSNRERLADAGLNVNVLTADKIFKLPEDALSKLGSASSQEIKSGSGVSDNFLMKAHANLKVNLKRVGDGYSLEDAFDESFSHILSPAGRSTLRASVMRVLMDGANVKDTVDAVISNVMDLDNIKIKDGNYMSSLTNELMISYPPPQWEHEQFDKALKEARHLMGSKALPTKFFRGSDRAYFMPNTQAINVGSGARKDALFHEMGHKLEVGDRRVRQAAGKYMMEGVRACYKKFVMRPDDEVYLNEPFFDRYMGRIYCPEIDLGTLERLSDRMSSDGFDAGVGMIEELLELNDSGGIHATEIISMGFQHFTTKNDMALLLVKEPKLFKLITDIMATVKQEERS